KLFSFTSEYSDTLYNYTYENVRENSQVFNNSIDVYQFFSQLAYYPEFQEIAGEILSVVDSLTVNSLAVYDNYIIPDIGRMSIYFPLYSFSSYTWEKYFQLSFVKETRWDRFLDFYFNDDNESPEILEFDISTKGNLVYFYWDAIDESFIKYQLQYRTLTDTSFLSILDSTSDQSYQKSFSPESYIFCLTAEDEFENMSDSTKIVFLSDEPIFKYYPNPFNINENNIGKFIISNDNLTDAAISIYNLAGELVDKIKIDDTTEQTIEVNYTPDNVSSGIYFCLLKSGNTIATIKLAVIR
ncbi:MAG: T9SS type A sorting domain-containing protein, partial [Candidatus Celaenobacter polaris]|nr:T9SS type A sorting domain-containing protein [Candidatus Celaenobacter polaris]